MTERAILKPAEDVRVYAEHDRVLLDTLRTAYRLASTLEVEERDEP